MGGFIVAASAVFLALAPILVLLGILFVAVWELTGWPGVVLVAGYFAIRWGWSLT